MCGGGAGAEGGQRDRKVWQKGGVDSMAPCCRRTYVRPSRCFTMPRRLLPWAAISSFLPSFSLGAIDSFQYGRDRSMVSFSDSQLGRSPATQHRALRSQQSARVHLDQRNLHVVQLFKQFLCNWNPAAGQRPALSSGNSVRV